MQIIRRFAALSLVLGLLGTPVTTHGQSSTNIDWAGVLSAESDPRIQVTSCGGDLCVSFPGSPPPNSGTAAFDRVSYGDIVGDGGTEAVVPIDSGGSIGEIGSLIYMLDDSGTPQLVVADGPGGNVSIDPSVNELVVVEFDSNCSSLRCNNLVRTGYTLVSGVLQQQDTCKFLASSADQTHPQGTCTPSGSPSASGPAAPTAPNTSAGPAVPSAAIMSTVSGTAHFNDLTDIPFPVLLPPAGLQPFASWPASSVSVLVQNPDRPSAPPGYGANFRTGTGIDPGADFAAIGANPGILATDINYHPENDRYARNLRCDGSGTYCTYTESGAQWELFRDLQVRGTTGIAVHDSDNNGSVNHWSLVWEAQGTDVEYVLAVGGEPSATYGTTFSPNNRAGAQKLAALANQLVVWNKQ